MRLPRHVAGSLHTQHRAAPRRAALHASTPRGPDTSRARYRPAVPRRAYLALAEGLAATQLLHFMFVGPFQDPHFTARDRLLGPERTGLNYSDTFDDGAGGVLRWRGLEVAAGVAAPTAMRMPASAAAASANRTVAVVLCTHLFVRAASPLAPSLDVLLRGSSSALAEITLNNDTVVSDRLITGLQLQEFSQRLTLLRAGLR